MLPPSLNSQNPKLNLNIVFSVNKALSRPNK